MPTWHQAIHRAGSDDDLGDGFSADYDFDAVFDEFAPSPSAKPQDTSVQEPEAPWRCLRCDSSLSEFDGQTLAWRCLSCRSNEFYQVNKPTKKVTESGTWMFVPNAGHSLEDSPPSSRSRRRRRKKTNAGGPSDPPGHDGFPEEQAESERLTNDPIVEFWSNGHSPRHSGRPADLPSAKADRPAEQPRKLDSRLSGRLQNEPNERTSSIPSAGQSWNSRKGPEPGIKWKSGQYPPVPLWKYDANDMRAFAKFSKKIKIWQLQMAPYASKKEQALLLYNSLTGEPEQELEHLEITDIYVDGGVEKILSLLQRPMEQRLIYQKRRYLHEFEVIRRNQGESMRAYILRFRRIQRCLKAIGIDIAGTYDNESLGSRLLDRSGLSHTDQRMVLVGTQQSLDFELIAEALVLQYPEFRAPPPIANREGKGSPAGKGSGKSFTSSSSSSTTASSSSSYRTSQGSGKGGTLRRQAYMTNVAEETNAVDADEDLPAIEEGQEEDEPFDVAEGEEPEPDHSDAEQDEEVDIQNLAQVLTVTAKKLSGITLGRKFTTGNAKKVKQNPDELRKVTHCGACGALGHWHADPECPHNKGKPARQDGPPGGKGGQRSSKSDKKRDQRPHQVSLVHHEHGGVHIGDTDEQYGSMFTVHMVSIAPFLVNEVKSFLGPDCFVGLMVIDTACQRTCCGMDWYNSYVKYLNTYKMRCKEIPVKETFQFGKGTPTTSTTRTYLPCVFEEFPLLIGASLLPEKIPLLGSNSLLDSLGSVIDFPNQCITLQAIGKTLPIRKVRDHICIELFDVSDRSVEPHEMSEWKLLSQPHVWTEPHPELVLMPDAQAQAAQARADFNSLKTPEIVNETSTTSFSGQMEADCPQSEVLCQERFHLHDRGSQVGHYAQNLASTSGAAGLCSSNTSGKVPASADQKVRELPRQVCEVQSVPEIVEVERSPTRLDSVVFPRSWISKLLIAITTIATAVINPDAAGHSECLAASEAQSQASTFNFETKSQLDELQQRLHPPHQPLDGGGTAGGLQHHGARAPGDPYGRESKDLSSGSIHQRRGLRAGQASDGVEGRPGSLRPPGGAGSHPGGGPESRWSARLEFGGGRLKWECEKAEVDMEAGSRPTRA